MAKQTCEDGTGAPAISVLRAVAAVLVAMGLLTAAINARQGGSLAIGEAAAAAPNGDASARSGLDLPIVALPRDVDARLAKNAMPGRPAVAVAQLPAIDAGVDGVLRIAMWGDSLAYEAEKDFLAMFGALDLDATVEVGAMGGTALCDFVDHIAERMQEFEYDAIVLAFSGNALTPCMVATDGTSLQGSAHTTAYADPLGVVLAEAQRSGAVVALAGGPIGPTTSIEADALKALYRDAAAARSTVVAIDVDARFTLDGEWTESLPCLAFEDAQHGCVDGEIVVRAPDGVHFCPRSGPAVDGVTDRCPRWSSGAYRYAAALAEPVLAGLDR